MMPPAPDDGPNAAAPGSRHADRLMERILGRPPTAEERATLLDALEAAQDPPPMPPASRRAAESTLASLGGPSRTRRDSRHALGAPRRRGGYPGRLPWLALCGALAAAAGGAAIALLAGGGVGTSDLPRLTHGSLHALHVWSVTAVADAGTVARALSGHGQPWAAACAVLEWVVAGLGVTAACGLALALAGSDFRRRVAARRSGAH